MHGEINGLQSDLLFLRFRFLKRAFFRTVIKAGHGGWGVPGPRNLHAFYQCQKEEELASLLNSFSIFLFVFVDK